MGLFSDNKKTECLISNQKRLWMEQAILWLGQEFGDEKIFNRRQLCPTQQDFPIKYDGSVDSLLKTGEIIANQMEINFSDLELRTYKQGLQEFQGDLGHRLFTQVDRDSEEKLSAGIFFNKNEKGIYEIFIEESNLNMPERLVATLAHEFSHIKILGENRLQENDESLTDLTTVIFGLGIFNANCAFIFHKSFQSWGYKTLGYLNTREWAFALALFAYFREEKSPKWIDYLSPDIKNFFRKGEKYIYENTDKIFLGNYDADENSYVENNQ